MKTNSPNIGIDILYTLLRAHHNMACHQLLCFALVYCALDRYGITVLKVFMDKEIRTSRCSYIGEFDEGKAMIKSET